MTKTKSHAACFLAGILSGGLLGFTVAEPDCASGCEPEIVEPEAERATGDSESDGTETSDALDVLAEIPSYCETFPDRCNIQAPCPVGTYSLDGQQIGGCMQAEYVCCSTDEGCWAIHWPTQCKHNLYWSDCSAGQSVVDPVTGQAYIVCHD